MILGIYPLYLEAIASINLLILIPLGIGLILGALVFLKIIKYCLNNFCAQTYYSILGFILGSVLILYPGLPFSLTGLICILCFIISFRIAMLIG